MKYILPTLTLLFLAITLTPATANSSPLEGYWLTENERSVIKVKQCDGDSLCGFIYWIIEGGMQTDSNNPDPALRSDAMCALKIMWGFAQKSESKWGNGIIYKADDGDTYSAKLKLMEDGRLKLRGYMGVSLFGKTQYWSRVRSGDYKRCK